MAKFRVGQEVTMKTPAPWRTIIAGPSIGPRDPQFGQIYVVEVLHSRQNSDWIGLVGFIENWYLEDDFEAVVPTLTIEKELEQLTVEA